MRALVLMFAVVVMTCPSVAGNSGSSPSAPAQKDRRGIYAVVLSTPLASAAGMAGQAALKVPGIDGLAFVCLWSGIEPSPGQYSWQVMDRWIALADSLGKNVTLVVRAGNATPSWLFQSAPGRAAAVPMNFRVSPHEGKTGVCDTETIAAPWDPAFLARWDTLLVALSAHLKDRKSVV
jgi:hypothetical protein